MSTEGNAFKRMVFSFVLAAGDILWDIPSGRFRFGHAQVVILLYALSMAGFEYMVWRKYKE